jgi:hypothetical protein
MLTTILVFHLAIFDPSAKAPVATQMENIKAIVLPNVTKFGTYALIGVGTGILIRALTPG